MHNDAEKVMGNRRTATPYCHQLARKSLFHKLYSRMETNAVGRAVSKAALLQKATSA